MSFVAYEKGFLDKDFLQQEFLGGEIGSGDACQVDMKINNYVGSTNNAQVNKATKAIESFGAQVEMTNLYYFICGGFLEQGFLEDSFLANHICAGVRSQVELIIDFLGNSKSQVDMQVENYKSINKAQTTLTINSDEILSAQIEQIALKSMLSQVLIALYNRNRPRVLYEFPSRGNGNNWTATSTEAGDFSILNVNNDLEEFYWRSATGVKSATLTSDTNVPQGIFLDTLGVLNHNLTTSAIVTLEGANNAGFSPVGVTIPLAVREGRILYVADNLPTQSWRYWRLIISDPTNSDNYLKIGTIVFGTAAILNETCAVDEIIEVPTEFKNSVRTEGFTSVGNSRSVKNALSVEFRDVQFDTGDYQELMEIIDAVRTTLKALWIFDPRNQSLMHRFTVFGKLQKLPQKRHKVKGPTDNMDHISFEITVDESE